MKSIRLYLLLSLLATITLVNFVSLLHGYQSSMQKAQTLFDSRLQSTAQLIASANSEIVERDSIAQQRTPHTYFQIIDASGSEILTRSNNAPLVPLGEINEGFHDINFASYRWRNFVYQDIPLNRWIVVAERVDIRYTLAEEVVIESLLPIIMTIPLAALIIWFAVGVGLRPLHQFVEQIRRKRADDLSPVKLDNAPTELVTLVDNTNALLTRLDDAFSREQRFSSDAAHELRTPISVLKVHLHNLQTRIGKQDEDLILLREGVERMGHLVEQILALYRTSPDQAAVKFGTLDLYQIAQNLIATLYDKFELKQQSIELFGEKTLIKGNAFAIETLLQNLLTNANKYTPEKGQIWVTITDEDGNSTITVDDSGPGIPESQYQRVFERFYRMHADRHDSGETGCGLGLTIVKHIVDLHQAKIKLAHSCFPTGLRVSVLFTKESQLRD